MIKRVFIAISVVSLSFSLLFTGCKKEELPISVTIDEKKVDAAVDKATEAAKDEAVKAIKDADTESAKKAIKDAAIKAATDKADELKGKLTK